MAGWIGVDLDGTLAEYNGWTDSHSIGKPIKPMVDRVNNWLREGVEVRIFTARVSDGLDETRKEIEKWLRDVFGQPLPVTNVKDYYMIELWDDRAVQVEINTGQPVGYSTRGNK